uniref:Uncharacterized protein n=1 Tax=Chrysotila carterae TaxID=13221 RepID=A0A7S4C4K0_CHRCT|mmetsp:Transcript_38371/g.80611  ORF Transcript_38371/g.80611 Transcript_38371/m.80611 type:complete len:420 (+) Transcript_38371:227-1486(+)
MNHATKIADPQNAAAGADRSDAVPLAEEMEGKVDQCEDQCGALSAAGPDTQHARWFVKSALLAIMLQSTALGLGWRLCAAGVSPVHASCCLCALLLQQVWNHPAISKVMNAEVFREPGFNRIAYARQKLQAELQDFAVPATNLHMQAFAGQVAADLAAGVSTAWTSNGTCEVVSQLLSAGSVALFLRAAWSDGSAASPTLSRASRATSVLAFAALVGALGSPQRGSDGLTPANATAVLKLARAVCSICCVSRCATAFGSTIVARVNEPFIFDLECGRLAVQLLGAVVLLGAAVMSLLLPSRDASDTIGLGLTRLGTTALACAAWLLEHPCRAAPPERVAHAHAPAYQSAESAREAHKAAMRRKRAAAELLRAETPLMVDSLDGGLQSLSATQDAMRRDNDGDEAHEFWEELAGGLLRRS